MRTAQIGKRGTVVIPALLRKKLGFAEGATVIVEETSAGLLLRPAMAVPLEIYSPRRKAELLLSNTVDAKDYRAARKEVKKLGFNPDEIAHHRP